MMNLNVFLKKIKIPIEVFIDLIKNGNHKEIGVDTLNCLKKILPDKSEIEKIRALHHDSLKETIEKADNFLILLGNISYYNLRIDIMTYLEEYDDSSSNLKKTFDIYLKCGKTILNNDSLKCFLKIILEMGNYINMNSQNGQTALGFKIDILPKLIEIKTNKPGVTFLHVCVEQFDKGQFDKNDEFFNDMKQLELIAKYFLCLILLNLIDHSYNLFFILNKNKR